MLKTNFNKIRERVLAEIKDGALDSKYNVLSDSEFKRIGKLKLLHRTPSEHANYAWTDQVLNENIIPYDLLTKDHIKRIRELLATDMSGEFDIVRLEDSVSHVTNEHAGATEVALLHHKRIVYDAIFSNEEIPANVLACYENDNLIQAILNPIKFNVDLKKPDLFGQKDDVNLATKYRETMLFYLKESYDWIKSGEDVFNNNKPFPPGFEGLAKMIIDRAFSELLSYDIKMIKEQRDSLTVESSKYSERINEMLRNLLILMKRDN
jgi:hypothetical protein